ncbi:helix-turn-helix transcriptional regulator [Saxibacter everestensis]|uniref:Helix-turn-helix transcriptional regulator n=1 Tax=Saxibacter everestensis TaxID=2909229 RepID=A0ABY8QV29_9MICO|nr:helix-turn-helix transcriptional regulator [Brevibacteriaceae bacterium ZFBP1038]
MGLRIREARAGNSLSQELLADRVGVDRKTISRVENGLISPKYDLIVDLAYALNVRVEWLVEDPGRPPHGSAS